MNKITKMNYALLFFGVFLLDRITKWWAVHYLTDSYQVSRFLSFDLAYNKGVSWSLFYSDHGAVSVALSVVIALVIFGLAFHSYIRWMNHYTIVGEILVLAGAVSNLIDRILYGGVVDFIHLMIDGWSWPLFNIADVGIVIGVCIMFVINYWYE